MSELIRYKTDKNAEVERIKKYKSSKRKTVKYGIIIFLLSLPVAIFSMVMMALGYWELTIFAIIPFVIIVIYIYLYFRQSQMNEKLYLLRDSIKTDRVIYELVNKMPAYYSYIKDVCVVNDDGDFPVDLIIISRYGVFTLTAVNVGGEIYGSALDRTLRQVVKGVKGKSEKYELENPYDYAAESAKAVEDLLSEKNINLTVYPILYFTDRSVKISLSETDKQSMPLITNSENASMQIVKYIDSFFGEYNLYTDEIAQYLEPNEIIIGKKTSNKQKTE